MAEIRIQYEEYKRDVRRWADAAQGGVTVYVMDGEMPRFSFGYGSAVEIPCPLFEPGEVDCSVYCQGSRCLATTDGVHPEHPESLARSR